MDFERLWEAYPDEEKPCSDGGISHFDNQCAIKMGLSLAGSGVDVASCPATRCWHGHGKAHILRGEELAAWMADRANLFGVVEIKRRVDASAYVGRRGIMFCRNFWGPGNEGDHIDLWNRDHFRSGAPDYIRRSEEVWFWAAP
jgi:Type VI secretion system (T6SS), amidase effector protein 4